MALVAYSLSELESLTQRDVFWLLREMQDDLQCTLDFNDDYIEEKSYVKFVKWFNKRYQTTIEVPAKVNMRAYSTTHRIEIAYKSKYRCNQCGILLPPTFEIDHIVEIRDGGVDEYHNLQALCPNCHSLKTRANTLKRDEAFAREFGKRAQDFEDNAFAKFKRV